MAGFHYDSEVDLQLVVHKVSLGLSPVESRRDSTWNENAT